MTSDQSQTFIRLGYRRELLPCGVAVWRPPLMARPEYTNHDRRA